MDRTAEPAQSAASLSLSACAELVDLALREDLGTADITPEADLTAARIVPAHTRARATIIARKPGVVAGLDVAGGVFHRLDAEVTFAPQVADGTAVDDGDMLVRLEGLARPLLAGERTALNFLQRLSGVATLTRTYVEAVAGTSARITDTRKTTPGFRLLEKQAVLLGGGVNHRIGLYDALLIKENHAASVGGVDKAVQKARQQEKDEVPIFVEARDLNEVRSVLPAAPDRILLDNMPPEQMREAVRIIRRASPDIDIEATGGVDLNSVRQVAETGVDLISIGALTHSAPALDLSMLFETEI